MMDLIAAPPTSPFFTIPATCRVIKRIFVSFVLRLARTVSCTVHVQQDFCTFLEVLLGFFTEMRDVASHATESQPLQTKTLQPKTATVAKEHPEQRTTMTAADRRRQRLQFNIIRLLRATPNTVDSDTQQRTTPTAASDLRSYKV